MSIPFLLGPVDTQDSFMLASIQNGNPYVLDAAPLGSGVIYYWNSGSGPTGLDAFGILPVFTANGTTDALALSDSTNGGGLGLRSDGVTLGNAPSPLALNWSQPDFATWQPPDVLLSRVQYSVLNSSGATTQILTGPTGNAPTIPADNVIILPVIWYSGCTQSGSTVNIQAEINQPADSIENWFCLVNSGITGCTGAALIQSGWTNLTDCVNDINYDYCPTGSTCGSDNCNGPCGAVYEDCLLGTNSNYECIINPEAAFADTAWWKSPYFIGAVIGIVVLILVIIFVIFILVRKGRPVTTPTTEPGGYQSFSM
jgi:hypothetical protein